MPNDAPNQPALDATAILGHSLTMLFTPELAKKYAPLAAASRKRHVQERDDLIKVLMSNQPPTQPLTGDPKDVFPTRQVDRVRKQIDMLNDQMDSLAQSQDLDASAVDRIASAISRLSELERTLSGRPMPGSFRPEKPRRQVASFTPPADS